jgi:uncharacterized oligopeptide transporter (OPT) family protein
MRQCSHSWSPFQRYGSPIRPISRRGLVPPVDRVYVAAIKAGASADVAWNALAWAIPGAIIQFLGRPKRQLGVLFSTGLLIVNPFAGWAILAGSAMRVIAVRLKRDAAGPMEVLAAGFIGGDALFGFFDSVIKTMSPIAR